MNERDLFDAITDTPDELVEEAHTTHLRKRIIHWQGWVALAACVALVIGAVYAFYPNDPYAPPVSTETIGGTASLTPLVKVAYPAGYGYQDTDTRIQIWEENPMDDKFLEAVTDFSYETTSTLLANTTGNQNYSPLSLYYALALAATGAEGETANQFYDLLGVDSNEELSVQCGNLYRRLYTDNEIGQLKIANSLWMQEGTPFYKDFVSNAVEQFYASSYSVDFGDKATGKAMGQWISDNTNGVLSPEFNTSPDNLMSIINTIYYYDQWWDEFYEKDTAADTFYLANGQTTTCDFMNATRLGSGLQKDGYTLSSLGLMNGGRMVFVLPDEGVSPQSLLSTPEQVGDLFVEENSYESFSKVVWKVPKFKFTSTLHLAEPLQQLGLTDAFSENADFSSITEQSTGIGAIQQQSSIGINEKGVEVASYTYLDYGAGGDPDETIYMVLDRPFIYGIVSSEGNLLFVGICEDPTAS